MSDKIDVNNINVGPLLPQDDEIKVNGNKVPENLKDVKIDNPPPAQKNDLTDSPVELRKQIDRIVSTELSPLAASIANSAFEALKAEVALEEIKANIERAKKDSEDLREQRKLNQKEYEKILQLLHMAVKERNQISIGQMPVIRSETDLTDYVRLQLKNDVSRGTSSKTGVALDSDNINRDVFEFKGLVFRADNRSPDEIIQAGGFTSRNDLSVADNKIEAMGLGKTKGATGPNGVSTADNIENAKNYLTNPKGRIYIIDTSKLGEDEHAYSMRDILLKNKIKNLDESGGEVNITKIHPGAIIGWIQLPEGMVTSKSNISLEQISVGINTGAVKVELNKDYV
ncbi:MAG: hypothetical protein II929_08935 [Succinivibrio sp.]|nr:hypothetical protein [Succinivibrio sp.]